MARQATMNGAAANGREPTHLGADLGGLGHDLVALAELQAGLLAADVRESARRSAPVLGAAGAAVLLALAALPVLLLGLAATLARFTPLEPWAALLVVALAVLAGAGLAAWSAWRARRTVLDPLRRSSEELRENVRWVKQVLQRPPRTTTADHDL